MLAMTIIIHKLIIKCQILFIFCTTLIFISLKYFNLLKRPCPRVTENVPFLIFKLLIVFIFE